MPKGLHSVQSAVRLLRAEHSSTAGDHLRFHQENRNHTDVVETVHKIAQHKQPEVMLVNAGVNADFGAYLDSMATADVKQILEAAPRTNFYEAFVAAAAVVAKRKPSACAHSFVADIGYCKVPGFHLPSFCDAVKVDPFAKLT